MLGTLAQELLSRKETESVRLFEYGDEETEFLRNTDDELAKIIDKAGHIYEYADPDMYTSLVRIIIGQQISIQVYERIWKDFRKKYGDVPDQKKVLESGIAELRSLGIPSKRAEYILGISEGFLNLR